MNGVSTSLLEPPRAAIIATLTTEIRDIAALPRVPAVYLMLGGSPRFAAYVGIGGDLRERVSQHLVKRDSSVVTGTTAVGLNPDHVREVGLEWGRGCTPLRNDGGRPEGALPCPRVAYPPTAFRPNVQSLPSLLISAET